MKSVKQEITLLVLLILILFLYVFLHEQAHVVICESAGGKASVSYGFIKSTTECVGTNEQIEKTVFSNNLADIVGYHTLPFLILTILFILLYSQIKDEE